MQTRAGGPVGPEAPAWTLEELVRRVGLALHDAARDGAYPGAPNARVREVPDQRAIRWYASTGLVDRPLGGRGRGARYTARHLLQLVAIKRLQASGLTLAEIQARLAGAGDEPLQAVAQVPPGLLEASPVERYVERHAERHAERAASRFWASVPPASSTVPVSAAPASAPPSTAPPATDPRETQAPQAFSVPIGLGVALPLGNGAVLVLPPVSEVASGHAPPDLTPSRRAAIDRAARPLLDLLADYGLVDHLAPEPFEGAHR